MLIVSSWSERLRSDIGFNGISQVWEGPPAWYFWLKGAPGAYHLEFLDAEGVALNGENFHKAVFVIKCYPYRNDLHFESFSFLERHLIQSNFFDDTNTPVFEYREKIPPDLFNVALLEMTMDHERQRALFSLETLETLRSRFARKTVQNFPILNLERQFAQGEIDRDIPGFKIAYPLFDCLMCLYANALRQSPCQVRCWQTPGFEIILKDGKADGKYCEDIMGYRIDVFYGSARAGFMADAMAVCQDADKYPGKIFYDRTFPCGHFDGEAIRENASISINKKWWTLARAQYASELASSCGCRE